MAKAVVLLSGGQDSTTALFWALSVYDGDVEALTINYGQRHAIELDAAREVASRANVRHTIIDVPGVLTGSSPLVNSDRDVPHYESLEALRQRVEPTFVPARNALFLAIAANFAASRSCHNVVVGVSQADYGGYPDCRQDFLTSMSESLSLALHGVRGRFSLQAPLIQADKRTTVRMAAGLPGCMEALAYSHTCYDGEYPPNPTNHASLLRAQGFRDAGLPDPLIVRAKSEGLLPEGYPDSGFVLGTPFGPHAPAPARAAADPEEALDEEDEEACEEA